MDPLAIGLIVALSVIIVSLISGICYFVHGVAGALRRM